MCQTLTTWVKKRSASRNHYYIGPLEDRLRRIRMPIEILTDTANVRIGTVPGENMLDVGSLQCSCRHDAVGHVLRIRGGLQPAGFADGVGRVVGGLDMNRPRHLPAALIGFVVVEQI